MTIEYWNDKDRLAMMAKAIRLLLPYVQHTCNFNQTDSPEDDYCFCDVGKVKRNAHLALDLVKGG